MIVDGKVATTTHAVQAVLYRISVAVIIVENRTVAKNNMWTMHLQAYRVRHGNDHAGT